MELKATLNKPYTDSQRLDFIVTNNRQQGYQIKETESALEAWGYTAEEHTAQEKQAQIADLVAQLDAIDLKTVRPLRAIQAGTGTEEDTAKLAVLEEQAESIRTQIHELQIGLTNN